MKGFVENRFGLVVLVLIALGALYGVAFLTRPAPAPPPAKGPQKVAVESVVAVCPAPRGAEVAVLSAQSEGAVAVGSTQVKEPGKLWRAKVKGDDPVVVKATGTAARGLEASFGTKTVKGRSRGLAGVRCTEPAGTTWLVGPGPTAAEVKLHLTNADAAPALADVAVYSAEGPVPSDAGRGITVKPGAHLELDLHELAPSATVVAVGVTTSGGRLAVAAKAVMDGRGVDWLPAAAPPATRVVVPGIPSGEGKRELLVAAPGTADATVQVRAVTTDGSYAMKGRETLDVIAGSVAVMDLTKGLDEQAAAIELVSDVPVVAGMVISTSVDVAFSAGTPSLELGAAVADNGKGSSLVLTAVGGPGRVRVGTATVDIPASRTKVVKVKAGTGVVVTPVSGEVYGGRVTRDRLKSGTLITAQPLSQGRIWTMLPTYTDDPAVVLP
ncbi:hypothetical protein GCM10010404_41220 [Nonomuraea africana]|uniref:HlyD family efflux transporter periplasmic adaptor subunit n=1 Tax=Nonomuraea africana TaxID=46171 RepID=A0ABR9KW28_9ACTN|nr:DUF5719 family protein [Nonomuraea africana]MBE1565737.1 hypothetical protein [Nonomuraea africana]